MIESGKQNTRKILQFCYICTSLGQTLCMKLHRFDRTTLAHTNQLQQVKPLYLYLILKTIPFYIKYYILVYIWVHK